MKKVLAILISLALTQGVISLCFMEDVKGVTRGEIATKEGKDVGIAVEEAKYFTQVTSRVIRLTGASSNVALAPPCSVIGIKGNNVILRDFYGKVETVEVEESKGIRVGDKVVVKDGLMKIGISPE